MNGTRTISMETAERLAKVFTETDDFLLVVNEYDNVDSPEFAVLVKTNEYNVLEVARERKAAREKKDKKEDD